MDWPDMLAAVREIQYKDWTFHIEMREGPPWLQVRFPADGTVQHGRKWMLSPYMTKSEFVQTCLKAVLAAEEHEARELFTYQGRAVFGPHIDIDALVVACQHLDVRKAVA